MSIHDFRVKSKLLYLIRKVRRDLIYKVQSQVFIIIILIKKIIIVICFLSLSWLMLTKKMKWDFWSMIVVLWVRVSKIGLIMMMNQKDLILDKLDRY